MTTATPRRADIDAFFTCQHPERFKIDWRSFYTRAQTRTDAVRARWPHALDLQYGPHPQQRLDLYLPVEPPTAAPAASDPVGMPLLVFLHGGGFREGDPALYGYLAEPYLERGIGFASVGYRLTPEAYLPETMHDAEDAVAWCHQHLVSRGIRPRPMVLAGHSAGAILTAHLALRTDWLVARGLPTDLLQAAVPISGVYDFADPTDHAEFFGDDARRAEASPLHLAVQGTPPRLLVAYGEHENRPDFARDSQRLQAAITARGGQADLLLLADLDHAQTASALADERSPLFQAALALLAPAPAGRA